jgi:aminoglycoside phosphotransferase (APT) family kinase protein
MSLGLPVPSRANRITVGWGGAATWQIERDGILQALRIFPSDADDAAARERAAMAAAHAGGVPAPPVHHTGSYNGFPYIVTSWCSGRTGPEAIRARPWTAWSLGMEMGRVQARLHRVIAPSPVRNRPGDWIGWAGESERELQNRFRMLSLRHDALLHLDYHPRNIVFEHGRVTGVIDWENVRAGDPRADVARTRAILWLARRSPEVPHLAVPFLRMFEAGWLRAYQRGAGQLEHMALFDAWAFAAMTVDLSPKLGEPGVWLLPSHLDAIHRRLLTLKRRMGIAV